MGDQPLARDLLAQIRQLPITDDHREALAAELERAAELEQMLH